MMDPNRISLRGFTLIELMIVVSIIGIISTVAIPNFRQYIRQAKMAESFVLIDGLQKAQMSNFAEHGYFMRTFSFASVGHSIPKNGKPFTLHFNNHHVFGEGSGKLEALANAYFKPIQATLDQSTARFQDRVMLDFMRVDHSNNINFGMKMIIQREKPSYEQ